MTICSLRDNFCTRQGRPHRTHTFLNEPIFEYRDDRPSSASLRNRQTIGLAEQERSRKGADQKAVLAGARHEQTLNQGNAQAAHCQFDSDAGRIYHETVIDAAIR